ncbi:MAG: AMP-dependent synthetase and ligase, partial [Caulobacteraceae bacterium]|nr:AMP-dependent synthetase and ligase [Caulobacteraceae bacterium]
MTDQPAAWPVVTMDEAQEILTAPGAPFEMRVERIDGQDMRVYVKALANLRDLFDLSLAHGERDFMRFDDERLTFADHWRAATAFGHALIDRFGVKKGDRVAIAMRNYPEWSICAWATMAVGAVLVPLNAWEPGVALADMLRDSGARLVVVDAERAERLAGQTTTDLHIVSVRDGDSRAGVIPLRSLIGSPESYGALPSTPLPDPQLAPDDDVTLFYTSGTTGRPKGVLGTHRNATTTIISTAYRVARAAVRRGQPPPKPSGAERLQLAPLPFFHVTGFNAALLSALGGGATLVLMYRWDVEQALDLIAEHQINVLTLVPSQAFQLATSPTVKARHLTSVDTVNYG